MFAIQPQLQQLFSNCVLCFATIGKVTLNHLQSQYPWVAHSGGGGYCHCHQPSLVPLPVIIHMHQPSSPQAVACSRGVWCHGHHCLPLVPVIVLSSVGGAGAGAGAIGIGVGVGIIVIVIPPSSCLASSWRW